MVDYRQAGRLLLLAGVVVASAPLSGQRGPAPEPTNLPADVLAQACAPTLVFEEPPAPLRVTGGQDSFERMSFHPGDLITINAGTQSGVKIGDEYYARRVQVRGRERPSRLAPATIRTTGWIRVWAVDDQMSLATITHACDSIEIDDYLEPFVLPVVPEPGPRPKAERGNYGRVIIGTDRRASFGRGDFMIVDLGASHGVVPGSQFVIYRDKLQDENFLYELGEAIAVDVQAETSTLRVTLSRDAFTVGDYVAIRRETSEATTQPAGQVAPAPPR